MRIRKTSIVRAIAGKIVNIFNQSQENAYSCDYVNGIKDTIDTSINNVKGQVLWTNSNPASDFIAQDINLSSSNYDVLEIFFYSSTSQTNSSSIRLRNKKNTILRWWDASRSKMYERGITYVNDTKLTIGECSMYNVGTSNNIIIPHKIIGYKTGHF